MGLERPRCADFHRYDGLRAVAHGITLELQWPEHPVFPIYGYVVRRRDLDQFVAEHAVEAGATLLHRHRGASRRCSTTACVAGRGGQGQGQRREPARSGPATSWSPTAPTRASAGRSARPANGLPAGHGHPRLLREPDARRPVDRVAPSTCATATATRCPATAGSSRWATAPSTSASACCRRSATARTSTRRTSWTEWAATAPGVLGHRPRRHARPAHRRAPADGRLGRPEGRARRGSSSATPPGRSTRSTARASTTPTRRGAWPPSCSTRRCATGDGLAAAALPDAARGRVRPVLQGGPAASPRSSAGPALMRELTRVGMQLAVAHGVGAADHGQPAARRTSSARPRPPTGRWPASPASCPTPRPSEASAGRRRGSLPLFGGERGRHRRVDLAVEAVLARLGGHVDRHRVAVGELVVELTVVGGDRVGRARRVDRVEGAAGRGRDVVEGQLGDVQLGARARVVAGRGVGPRNRRRRRRTPRASVRAPPAASPAVRRPAVVRERCAWPMSGPPVVHPGGAPVSAPPDGP